MNRKKFVGWTAAISTVLTFLMIIGGYFVLKGRWFHHYVLAQIIEQGQSATGGRLEVQNWDFHVSPLAVDLYGIVLHGTESATAKPLLQADKLTVGVSLRFLLHRKLEFTELLVQHPVAALFVNKHGQSNFPAPPPTRAGSTTTTVWDLAIQHTLLDHGELDYNNYKAQLNADVYDLRAEIYFDPSATRYTGSISYQNGQLQFANYPDFAHNVRAQFSGTPNGASLDSLLLTVGSSQVVLHGQMADYNSPKVDAAYQILIHAQDFAALSPANAPAGDLRLSGKMHYEDVPNQPLLRAVSMDGSLESSTLQTVTSQGRLEVRNIAAQYQFAHGDLHVHDITADIVNGHFLADLGIQHLDATPQGRFHATLQHLSLASARQSIQRADVRGMPVTGTVEGKIDGSWKGNISKIQVRADGVLRAAVWNNPDPALATPVDGTLHLAYDGEHNTFAVHQTMLRMPSTSVIMDGELGSHSTLRVHAVAGDLHQLSVLASSLRSGGSEPLPATALSGTATLDAVVQGSLQKPRIVGQLDAENLQVQGGRWKSARITLQANHSQLTIEQGSLLSARQGELSFSAAVGLENWSYLSFSPITANLVAKGLSLADLEHLANVEYPITGNLSANISFRGSQLKPAGHGSLKIANGSAYNQPIQNLAIQFQAANDTINSVVNMNLPAGSASATLAYTPNTKAYEVHLDAPSLVLQKLQAVQANLPLVGTLTASASGEGTIDNPQLDMTLQIPTLQVRGTAITAMKAQLNVRDERANLSLTSNVTQAFVRANATVDLSGNYNAQATMDTNNVPLDPFLALYVPSVPAGFYGETELHASLKGPLKDRSKLEVHLIIPTFSGSYQSLQFNAAGPIRADYADSVIDLAPVEIRGTQTSLHLQAHVPMRSSAAMTVRAQGAVNLQLLSIFDPDLKSAGAINFDVHGSGTVRKPEMQGKIQVNNVALATSDVPIGLSKVNGTLDVTNDSVQITSLSGDLGGGQISAGGSIVYRPSLQFNLALQGKTIRLLYPEGMRTVLQTNLTFTGNMQSASLTGRALVDSLNFTPDFDLSAFAGQFNGISVPSSGQSFSDNIKLAVAVQSTQKLSARSSHLNLEGAANLQVKGTVSNPVVTGRIDLSSGELFFLNNRYQLQRGIVSFDDPDQTSPVLNMRVTTTVEQYNLTLTLNGPIDKLTTNYTSDPSLPAADIISLIYRGQTVEEASAAGTSTDSLLAGQAASQFSSGIQKMAGISSLQIDPMIGGNNTNPSARIALQQRVTKNFLFTFSTDVTQPQSEIMQGEYQLSKRWSVAAARDQFGGVSVNGRYHANY